MKVLAALLLLISSQLFAQQSISAVSDQNLKLVDRYQQMKLKSQTYGDYKVIKETTLDEFWRITMDSVKKTKILLRESHEANDLVSTQLKNYLVEIKQKEMTIEEITYAGTHINVLGIDFHKAVFVSFALLVIVGLLVVLGVITGRLKLIYYAMKDKMETVNILSQEFETYKRKALEKQMKLSRELQDERNRILELRRA